MSLAAVIVGSLGACGVVRLPDTSPAPVVDRSTSRAASAPASAPASQQGVEGAITGGVRVPGSIVRNKAQWLPAQWRDLPGWEQDRAQDWWPALHRSCLKPNLGANPAWAGVCAEVSKLGSKWGQQVGDEFVRQWVQGRFQPWRVVSLDANPGGLLTGYFEPLLEARRQADARFAFPLHRPPADLGSRKPHFSRSELETSTEGRSALAGRELVYLSDPLDVLLVQVQGSGRVKLLDELTPQGTPKVVRLAFAGHNDQPYQSVARWLVDQGAITLEQASWPAIRNWATQNPARVGEMLRANPRVVFFKEEPLLDAEAGPLGAQAVPLTPGRSVAVDRDSVPLGTPLWIDSTVPQPWSSTPTQAVPLQRLVMAQDTGGAIVGAVRADFFWGWGDEALAQAGRTKQALGLWVLWPVSP